MIIYLHIINSHITTWDNISQQYIFNPNFKTASYSGVRVSSTAIRAIVKFKIQFIILYLFNPLLCKFPQFCDIIR